MKTILALDQGTTGSTALVVGEDGSILAKGYREFTQHFPEPGQVEHDPDEIWRVTVEAATEAIASSGTMPGAVGITNQRETVVVWDRNTGQPLHRALVWQDRRTSARCRELQASLGDDFIASRTGLVWDPYFSGTKIEWLLEHVPDLRSRVESGSAVFGTIDAWLIYKLTGGRTLVTDHSNACRTLLYNIRDHAWDDELLSTFGVPAGCLPEVVSSSGVMGDVDPDLFGGAMYIGGAVGDQQAALFGQACVQPGEAKCTYGTGAFLLMNVGTTLADVDPTRTNGLLTTVGCSATGEPAYALEGSIFIAGAAVQWLRDGLEILSHAAETEALARSVEDSGGVYFVPALTGLGAPHWESEARGTIVGITRGTGRAHLVRAALESMAFGTRELSDTMTEVSGVQLTEMKVDGGAAQNRWLMERLAGVLGVNVARPDVLETTALGAAGLAGLATGIWSDVAEFSATRTYTTVEPGPDGSQGWDEWQRAVRAAISWAQDRG